MILHNGLHVGGEEANTKILEEVTLKYKFMISSEFENNYRPKKTNLRHATFLYVNITIFQFHVLYFI